MWQLVQLVKGVIQVATSGYSCGAGRRELFYEYSAGRGSSGGKVRSETAPYRTLQKEWFSVSKAGKSLVRRDRSASHHFQELSRAGALAILQGVYTVKATS